MAGGHYGGGHISHYRGGYLGGRHVAGMNRWHGGPTWHGNNCTAITDMVLAGINRNIQPPNEISKRPSRLTTARRRKGGPAPTWDSHIGVGDTGPNQPGRLARYSRNESGELMFPEAARRAQSYWWTSTHRAYQRQPQNALHQEPIAPWKPTTGLFFGRSRSECSPKVLRYYHQRPRP